MERGVWARNERARAWLCSAEMCRRTCVHAALRACVHCKRGALRACTATVRCERACAECAACGFFFFFFFFFLASPHTTRSIAAPFSSLPRGCIPSIHSLSPLRLAGPTAPPPPPPRSAAQFSHAISPTPSPTMAAEAATSSVPSSIAKVGSSDPQLHCDGHGLLRWRAARPLRGAVRAFFAAPCVFLRRRALFGSVRFAWRVFFAAGQSSPRGRALRATR